MLFVEYSSVLVRMYAYLKKKSSIFWVNKAQTLMSNFLLSIKNGFSMYFCITNEQLFSLNFYWQAFFRHYSCPASGSLSVYLSFSIRQIESSRLLMGLVFEWVFSFSYFEGLSLSFFYFFFICSAYFVDWVNFFLWRWSKNDINIF